MPVTTASQEAEAGESLEPERRKLYHCTPAWMTEQDSISKKQTKNVQNVDMEKNRTANE